MAHQQSVDGEIAARDVFLRSFGIDDLIGMATVGVAEIGAKCGDFDFKCIARHENNAELRADGKAVGKELHDLIRRGVGGDVVIGGIAMQERCRARIRRRAGPGGRGVGEFRRSNWRVRGSHGD